MEVIDLGLFVIISLDNKFLYIDRVAIKKSFTRSGIGTAVYKMLFDHADREKLPIYCEVNIEPINPVLIIE